MLNIDYIVNKIFNSITYIISTGGRECWLVDCGDVEKILEHGWQVQGVLLTHAHFDHIYGLNTLIDACPTVKVITNIDGKSTLQNPKWNFSHYHEKVADFIFQKSGNVREIVDGVTIELFDGISAQCIDVPGHDPSCVSYIINDSVFTGDAYIPGIKTLINFPRSNKIQAANSLSRLQTFEAQGYKIFPGHLSDGIALH